MPELKPSPHPIELIPPSAVLEDRSYYEWTNGVQINELNELDSLLVQTKHHTYEITVVNPTTAEVLIRGGEFLPERTVAYVSGASMGGSFLKLHGIYVGFKLEMQIGARRIGRPVCAGFGCAAVLGSREAVNELAISNCRGAL